jgi:hypothetical protein
MRHPKIIDVVRACSLREGSKWPARDDDAAQSNRDYQQARWSCCAQDRRQQHPLLDVSRFASAYISSDSTRASGGRVRGAGLLLHRQMP